MSKTAPPVRRTDFLSAVAEVDIALPEPREMRTVKGGLITVTLVQWRRRVDREGRDYTTTVLFADDNDNVGLYGFVPSWVPRPPAGWDSGVIACTKAGA